MTSYREVKCEYTNCSHTWVVRFHPEHLCPMCCGQQFRDGKIFLYFEEAIQCVVSQYVKVDFGNSDEVRGHVKELRKLAKEFESLRLQYESDSEYTVWKRLERFDELGNAFANLVRPQSFDWELFDIPVFFKTI